MNETTVLTKQEDNTLAIIQTAPDALLLNESIVEKAVTSCTALLERMRKEGMNDKFDTTANAAMVKLKDRFAEIKDRRMPLTKMFDEIRSKFTELEAQIDPAKPSSIYGQLQAMRNAYATQKIEAQRKAEAERERKLKADQEKFTLKSEAELQLRKAFLSNLAEAQYVLIDTFEGLNLSTIDDFEKQLPEWHTVYNIADHNAVPINIKGIYTNAEEIENIKLNARVGKFETWAAEYAEQIKKLKQEIADKLQGKRVELEEIATADAKRKKQLEAESEERRRQESERMEEERKQAELKAAQEAESKKAQEQTELMFNSAVEATENASDVKAVESYEIEVLNKIAWMEIFRFWFMKEGMNMEAEKIEKKSMKQMKSFCESYYKKHNEKIDSPYIKYSPVYKVRAEK